MGSPPPLYVRIRHPCFAQLLLIVEPSYGLVPCLTVLVPFGVGLIICFQILAASMLSDLVDQSELKTGRRSEGLFFAAATFIRKATQGLGLMVASMLLYLADFPEGADTTQVSAESVNTLVMLYIPTILFIWITMLLVISRYQLDRSQHEDNLRQLAERNSAG